MEKNRVEVVIDGQIITLVSDEKEAYMQKVALYIDKKLGEIKSSKSNKPITEHLRTLLISVNIADDYFKALEQYNSLNNTHQTYVREMGLLQEENILLSEKLHELQAQLSYVREQYVKEVGQLQEEMTKLIEEKKVLEEQAGVNSSQELEEIRQESARLAEVNRNLTEQLQYARSELEEYISTFDKQQEGEIKNVVNFNSGTGR